VRKYRSYELVAEWMIGSFRFSGNCTWSKLRGNYEGEAASQPGSGQGINYYRVWEGRTMFDHKVTDPVGNLAYDVPINMNWTADWMYKNKMGRTVVGYIYRYQSGWGFAYTRGVNASYWADWAGLTGAAGSVNAASREGWLFHFGSGWTQYMDNKRQIGRFNGLGYHDLAITHDFNVYEVLGKPIRIFAKLTAYNFINHIQQYSWDTAYRQPQVANPNTPWVVGPNTANWNQQFGHVRRAHYGAARSVFASAGLRF
jgi:hypothetical protein